MEEKKEFITCIANENFPKGKKLKAQELARVLNEAGFNPGYGGGYRGGRGTLSGLVSGTWDSLTKSGRHKEAEAVARTFVGVNGKPPYEK